MTITKKILFLFILLTMLITSVYAAPEIAQGELGGDEEWNSQDYHADVNIHNLGYSSGMGWRYVNIEYSQGLKTLVHFDPVGQPMTYTGEYGYNISITGYSLPCTFNVSNTVVGTGYIGYQRYFSGFPATEQGGYQYLSFDTWTGYTLTGTQVITPVFNTSLFAWSDYTVANTPNDTPIGYAYIANAYMNEWNAGTYLLNKETPFLNNYTATKPSGIGITGTVNKTPEGTAYGSRIYIVDGSTNQPITAESTVNVADFYFNVASPTIKICAFSGGGDWYNTSKLFNITTTTTIPTPLEGKFSITATPASTYFNQPVTATLYYDGIEAVSTQVKRAVWTFSKLDSATTDEFSYYEAGSDNLVMDYAKSGSNWYGWNVDTSAYDNDKGTTFPNPVSLITDATGNIRVNCWIYGEDGFSGKEYKDILIAGTGTQRTLQLIAKDFSTDAIISGATFNVYDMTNSSWRNATVTGSSYTVTYPNTEILNIYASAEGYAQNNKMVAVTKDEVIEIPLYSSSILGNETIAPLLVKTYLQYDDGSRVSLNGVTVTLGDGQRGTSTNSGITFYVTNESFVSILAEKTGYISTTKTIGVTGLTIASMYLVPTNSVIVTPSLTPVPSYTPIATITPAGNLTTCKKSWEMPDDSTPVDMMKNNIACWGVNDLESQNLAFAALIILFCALILGKIGKGTGAAIGGLIGFVLASAAHFIPFHILVLGFIFIGAYFAHKFLGGGN